jgi:hypothetical protein
VGRRVHNCFYKAAANRRYRGGIDLFFGFEMVMDISIVIVCMCLLTLVLCKNYTNSKSQLIKLFEKHETYRVPDILAFVLRRVYV